MLYPSRRKTPSNVSTFSIEFVVAMFLAVVTMSSPLTAQNRDRAPNPYRDFVGRFAKATEFSGSVLVARGDNVLYRGGFGLADREWRRPNGADTKFRLASITKPFTAALIMRLVDRGEVELDAPITRYLTDYREDTGSQVTVRHLLTHSSGIPSYTSSQDFRAMMRERHDVAEFIVKQCSGGLEFKPGSRFRYNNSGYFLLGAIIAKVTGKRFDIAMREEILDPFGLDDTGYDRARTVLTSRAVGHDRIGGIAVPTRFIDMTLPYAAGAMYSTVNDMFKFSRALSSGQVMSQKSFTQAMTRQIDDCGFGWFLDDLEITDERPVPIVMHNGGINGFSTSFIRCPGIDGTVVVLGNISDCRSGELARALTVMLHGEKAPEPTTKSSAQFWQRVHAGDIDGAQRIRGDFAIRPGGFDAWQASSPRDIRYQAEALADAGHIQEAVAVLRMLRHLEPKNADDAAFLARLATARTAPPQFIEQFDAMPGPVVWTEAVHVIDVNRDGKLDVLFVNCNGWRRPGDMAAPSADPLMPTLLINKTTDDGLKFVDRSANYFPEDFRLHAKNAAVCDVDGDGHDDIVFAVAFGAQQRLLRFDPSSNRFVDETKRRLPHSSSTRTA